MRRREAVVRRDHRAFLVDNEVRGILGFNIDITERKSAHDALRESEQKYRELVETANSIILRLDREGRIVFFNEYAQRFFGYKDDEILGRSAVGTIVPEVDSSGRDLTQMIRDLCTYPERFANNQNENVRRNGERVWIAWTNKLVFDDQREITGLLCIGNDVTKRKRGGGPPRERTQISDALREHDGRLRAPRDDL